MGLRWERVKDEFDFAREAFKDWYQEIVVDNAPRYSKPREYVHLWIDLLGATIQLAGRLLDRMHYLWAHIVGVGLPIYLLWRMFH